MTDLALTRYRPHDITGVAPNSLGQTMNLTKWHRIRMALLCGAFAGEIFCGRESDPLSGFGDESFWFFTVASVFTVLASPFMVAIVISLVAALPSGASFWTRPTFGSNPFQLQDPLHFIHFASTLIIAGGLGETLSSLRYGLPNLVVGTLTVLGGLGILLGIQLAMRWCRHKMKP